jgi:hypothetical protein
MPNGAHGDRSQTVTRGRPVDAEAERRATEDNCMAAACALARQYGGAEWEISTVPFTFSALGARPTQPPRLAERMSGAEERKRQHEAHCLGEHPVYFRDRNRVPTAIAVTLVGWHDDDMSATILAARYRLTTAAVPDWATAANSRMVLYRRSASKLRPTAI